MKELQGALTLSIYIVTLTINPSFLCLSTIGVVRTLAITGSRDQSSSISFSAVQWQVMCLHKFWFSGSCSWYPSLIDTQCGAMLFSKFSTKLIFGAFSGIDPTSVMKIYSRILRYTHSYKWIPLCVKSSCCSTGIALTQFVLRQPFLKLTQNKEGLQPPPV